MNIEQLIKDSPDAIIVLDDQDLVVYWNQGATETFGYTEEEMMGKHLDNIIPEKLRKRHTEAFLKYIETGKSKYERGHTMAVPATHKDGSRRSIEFRISAEVIHGQVKYVAAIVRDVTDKWNKNMEQIRRIKELEAQLREKEDSL